MTRFCTTTATLNPLRVKITMYTGESWYASAPIGKGSDDARIASLNRAAKRRGTQSTYVKATEAEYWDYRRS